MEPLVIVDRGGTPRLANSRINVYDIVPYLEAGESANYIAAVLLLSTAEVQALIRYIEENKDEVMAVHRRIEERVARGNPPEIEAKLKVSRAKLLARKAELERKANREKSNGESPSR